MFGLPEIKSRADLKDEFKFLKAEDLKIEHFKVDAAPFEDPIYDEDGELVEDVTSDMATSIVFVETPKSKDDPAFRYLIDSNGTNKRV